MTQTILTTNLDRLTFDQTIKAITPAHPHMALLEPWTAGGKLTSGFIVSHHRDLPKVFGYLWKFHPSYRGPLQVGDFVTFERYQYETIIRGRGLDVHGNDVNWELAVIDINKVDALILDHHATAEATP